MKLFFICYLISSIALLITALVKDYHGIKAGWYKWSDWLFLFGVFFISPLIWLALGGEKVVKFIRRYKNNG